MALWVVNVGRSADLARRMIVGGVIGYAWRLTDLSVLQDREALHARYRDSFPETRGARLVREVGQMFSFTHRARPGDVVVMPLHASMPVAVGEITGGYRYRQDPGRGFMHVREVKWLHPGIAAGELPANLRPALATLLEFCRVQRREMEKEVRSLAVTRNAQPPAAARPPVDGLARAEMLARLRQCFGGARLRKLAHAILEARGLARPAAMATAVDPTGDSTFVSPPTSSPGVRLCLRVRDSGAPAGVTELRSFAESVRSVGAEQGLVVSWGGLADEARRELPQLLPRVHVWDAEAILEAMLSDYERLPDEIQAEIPLRRIWALEPITDVTGKRAESG